ncbi:hypothetical protein RIF29_21336 [Crotalaria pallida]|uniref:Endonuclease/exonuclease/phosphatase n=1 Tax=Crotalaria pallida TaxID=3830 RepID=A0AAN9F2T6_CROPI
METKKKVELQVLHFMKGLNGFFAIDCIGHASAVNLVQVAGLTILWGSRLNVDVGSSSLHHIDLMVIVPDLNERLCVTCLYGYAEANEKFKFWDLLTSFSKAATLPWLTIGDFNQVLRPEDKLGGNAI